MESILGNNKSNSGLVLWFTGLSGSGKTTLANQMAIILQQNKIEYELIDGDEIRKELALNLGFNDEGRRKNIAIAGYLAKVLSKHNIVVLVSLISPFNDQRNKMKEEISNFVEIFVNAPIDVCIQRDEKGLYKKALAGEIENFTGISHTYEAPINPDIELRTDKESIKESLEKVIIFLTANYSKNIMS